jgi:hypothetical protein
MMAPITTIGAISLSIIGRTPQKGILAQLPRSCRTVIVNDIVFLTNPFKIVKS